MAYLTSALVLVLLCPFGRALPQAKPYKNETSTLQVDLGYAVYQGYPDQSTGLDAWLGIRYAAPPTGNLRWRAPQSPSSNTSQIIDANTFPPFCPQTPLAPGTDYPYPYQGDEDCLFLNVFAPVGAQNLPVLFHIHGGGYGGGAGQQNLTQLSMVNGYGFVSVSIQYRLGGLGFLAGNAVRNGGDLNVGLLDQYFALEWVQQHIHKFGGNPRKVTIEGVSAGGGSVMLLATAYGGRDGTRLFENGIASSLYEPSMYRYCDAIPEQNFLNLAEAAGCSSNLTGNSGGGAAILDCLRKTDTDVLQYASFKVGSSGNYGSWAFVPVVDDNFARELPSKQLLSGKVNGRRILASHNSNDGAQFVSQNTTDFTAWLRTTYPLLTARDIKQIDKTYYPASSCNRSTKFATCGNCGGATMLDVGPFATGNLQRAIAFYSEATFACPSYWFSGAFQSPKQAAYKYQLSVVPGYHGMDLLAESLVDYPNALATNIGPDFHLAMTTIWGNMIKTGNPSISKALANGNSTNNTLANPVSQWPRFSLHGKDSWKMIDLNQTGGIEYETLTQVVQLPAVKQYMGPGLQNSLREVDAHSWEGGQAKRCDFLRSIGERIPI